MTTQQAGAPRELLADRAYVQLRDLIITLRIRPGDPIDEAFTGAVAAALRIDFTRAMEVAALYALAAVGITGLLVCLLPRAKPKPDSGAR